jgi:CubicO group peptidase (beta-lactamase class C family)
MIPLLSLAALADVTPVLDAVAADHSGIIVIAQGDAVLHTTSSGQRAPGDAAPPDAEAVFWTGSISKQFTAVAAMSLVDDGRLRLDQPVASVFSELDDDALALAGAVCTVERLLKATCGLPRSLDSPQAYASITSDRGVQKDFLADIAQTPLLFAPGSDHLYSNDGYTLAGLMVTRAAGAPLDAVLAPLLAKAGMSDTGTDPSAVDGFDDRVAWGQLYLGGWRWAGRWVRLGPRSPTRLGAAGNVFSTASDLIRWTRALHHGVLLSAESHAALTAAAHDDYAMGLVVEGDPGDQVIWHNGALEPHGYSTAVMWLEATDTTLVVLNNQSMSLPPGNATRLMRQLQAVLTNGEVNLSALEATTAARRAATIQGAIRALLGPLLLGMALLTVWRAPRHGRLTWVGSGVSLSLGALMAMTIFSPLSPQVLGLLVISLCTGHISRLRQTAGQPLIHPAHRLRERVSLVVSGLLITFFALAPVTGPQVLWAAAAMLFVAGVELWRTHDVTTKTIASA